MRLALRRGIFLLVFGVALGACTPTGVSLPFSEPAAAVVDGHSIPMKAYQARLQVSRHRDPFNGVPEAIPSPAPSKRLEDFTIDQLVREEIVRQEAEKRGITIDDRAVQGRIDGLRSKDGPSAFNAALSRNGFTAESFGAYEVSLIRAMAGDRARSAAGELKSGATFASVAARWSDDTGTFARGGDAGWLRPAEIPEPPLAKAVGSLTTGAVSGIVQTNRGFTIASVLERRNDQVHLAVILVLAPSIDLYSPQGTGAWFTKFVDDRESALRGAGKIVVKVGSSARG